MAPTLRDFYTGPELYSESRPMTQCFTYVEDVSAIIRTGVWAGMTALWTWIRRVSRTFYRTAGTSFRTSSDVMGSPMVSGMPSSSTVPTRRLMRIIIPPDATLFQILMAYLSVALLLCLLAIVWACLTTYGPIPVKLDLKWLLLLSGLDGTDGPDGSRCLRGSHEPSSSIVGHHSPVSGHMGRCSSA